jgi:two-component system chemotaxis response regulator CheB
MSGGRVGIVAIGASRGGLAVIEGILRALPDSCVCPIVIVQHRGADDDDGRLVELLQAHSVLPVGEPEDKEALAAGRVYLAPPGYHLLVERKWLSLSVDPPVVFARPSIDVLFESVADAFGAEAIAVMLTGASGDGSLGAAAVKRAGGRVLVQDPATAECATAPRAVLERTSVDAVLDVFALSGHIAAAVAAR